MMKFCFEHSNPDAQVIYAASIDWIPIVLLTLVTYNIKLYLPRILIQSQCLFMYTLGQVYNSALTLWRTSRLHDGLDRSVGDSINVLNILESVVFLVFYDFFKPSEFCKIFPQIAGNGISETLDFKIFREACLQTP